MARGGEEQQNCGRPEEREKNEKLRKTSGDRAIGVRP